MVLVDGERLGLRGLLTYEGNSLAKSIQLRSSLPSGLLSPVVPQRRWQLLEPVTLEKKRSIGG